MDQTRSLLRTCISNLLETQADVPEDVRFLELGLTSAQAVALVSELSRELGRPLALSVVWEHPTIAALAKYLSSGDGQTRSKSVRPSDLPTSATSNEPIAIVGMGCRLPGGIQGPESFWKALMEGVDAVREVPADRWDLKKWFDQDAHAPGKMSTRWGGFLDEVAGFDAGFFRISPKEAAQMDPQQRLALEVNWEALEDAGIVPELLDGTRTGVFTGAWSQDYAELAATDVDAFEAHSATGFNNSIIPARIAYSLGLRGPAMTVNTACSSSLVAVHLAAQSLRSGESDLALVSAVNLLLSPNTTVQMTKFGGMSPTGRCRTFDAAADGYVRGEGCGALVLRRLSDALRAGERIYAVIRGSAVNNDGASNGLTAPNPDAQREVIEDAWRRAGVAPHEVGYVEAHGTGTRLGDPIEASALGAVLGRGRTEPLRVGSLKTQLGHLEGAAGIAGLMKTALALFHGELPGNLHFEKPNPLIDFEGLCLKVVSARESWPSAAERHAGVSSFGYGGTNAHVALGEAPYRRSPLKALAARKLAEQLDAVEQGRSSVVQACERPRVTFVFSGHGSQWLGMGRDLLASEPTFARVLRECDRAIQAEGGFSVITELCAPEAVSRLALTDVVQPAIFAIQVALARTLQSWGVQPSAVVGQSIGEVAAAVIGGALSEQAGAKLIVRWSSLVARKVSGHGRMIVAALRRDDAESWLDKLGLLGTERSAVSVCASLAPESVSFAGTNEAVRTLEAALQEAGVRVQAVSIDYACHTPLMAPTARELEQLLHDIVPCELSLPMWSTVYDRFVQGAELGASYWAANLESPIGLARAVEALSATTTHFVEVAPHPIAMRSIEAGLCASAASSAVVLATCWRAEPAPEGLERLVCALSAAGATLDWSAISEGTEAQRGVALPLLVSGKSEAALRAQAGHWASWLKQNPDQSYSDVVRTAALQRTQFTRRAAILAESAGEAIQVLEALGTSRPHAALLEGTEAARGQVVFVFPGQGSQWPAMGRAMLEQSEVFARVVRACDEALRPFTGWSVLEVLRGESSLPLERVDVVQPALFTMNVALAALWRSLGIEPAAVVGHSQGEIAAAVVSGALSLEDGARVMALRSRLLLRLAGSGAMAMVELPAELVERKLRAPTWSGLYIAVVNTPTSTVVAGSSELVDAWVEDAKREGVFCRRVAVDYASHTPHVDPILAELRSVLSALRPRAASIPMMSTVTGEIVDGTQLDAEYWCRNLREPVRLDRALAALLSTGHDVFVESSAHPVLSLPLGNVAGERGVVVGSLRRDDGGLTALYANLAALHVVGVQVPWAALLGTGPLSSLPTYAFQHQRYWLTRSKARSDVSAVGLSALTHPFLGSITSLAENGRHLLTGRIVLGEQEWLADHAVFGSVIVPGTGLLELMLQAARAVGSPGVAELTLAAPLMLTERAVRLQILVDAPNAQGGRPFSLYSRPDEVSEDQAWTQNATGLLFSEHDELPAAEAIRPWPPAAATPLDLSGMYAHLARLGYEYGETFQCLRRAWKVGRDVFAEVSLPSELGAQAGGFGVHPALLDASLHAVLVAALDMEGSDSIWLPFTWSEVCHFASGTSELRVRFSLEADEPDTMSMAVTASDASGRPVLRAGALKFRRATSEQLRNAAQSASRDLYRVDWRATVLAGSYVDCQVLGATNQLAELLGVEHHACVADLLVSLESGAPRVLVIDAISDTHEAAGASLVSLTREAGPGENPELPQSVREKAVHKLLELQALLSEPRLAATELVWLTHRALPIESDDGVAVNLSAAPVWGMVRTARSENSDRSLRLIDLDEERPTRALLQRLIGSTSEPELAVRQGGALVPRLVRLQEPAGRELAALHGTVLVTGGMGELGQGLAAHLVAKHGVEHLVLTSRRGMKTPGAEALVASLEEAGARSVKVVACDVSVREEVASVIDAIPLTRPLSGVFHLAGVLDDAITTSLTADQLSSTFLPKVDGAWHLHELTLHQPLSTFMLFSSVAGVLGFQGQANYAAANAFLDALAVERRRLGLPAQSLAWGFWEQQGIGMSAHLGESAIARMSRQGVAPLPVKAGFAALDDAMIHADVTIMPARLDLAALSRAFPTETDVPPVFRSLVQRGARSAAQSTKTETNLLVRLNGLPEAERKSVILSVVREEVATVLGLTPFEVGVDLPLRSLGLDSLMAVELKNRLTRKFDATLPTTLAFDYPTASAIAGVVREKLKLDSVRAWSDTDVRGKLDRISIAALRASGVLDLLMEQPEDAATTHSSRVVSRPDVDIDDIEHDSLLELMESMLGTDNG